MMRKNEIVRLLILLNMCFLFLVACTNNDGNTEEFSGDPDTTAASVSTNSYSTEIADSLNSVDIMSVNMDLISLGFAEGDSPQYVSRNLNPDMKTPEGYDITWESSKTDVLSDDGRVMSPNTGTRTYLRYKATISSGEETRSKYFDLYIAPEPGGVNVSFDPDKLKELEKTCDVRYNDRGNVCHIEGQFVEEPVYTAEDAFSVIKGMAEFLGIKDVVNEIRFEGYFTGGYTQEFVFQRYFEGVKVIGEGLSVLSYCSDGKMDVLDSRYRSDLEINTIPEITAGEAEKIVSLQCDTDNVSEAGLFIYEPMPGEEEPILVWSFYTDNLFSSEVFVNAWTGEIVFKREPDID